jgi:hypothetical protein
MAIRVIAPSKATMISSQSGIRPRLMEVRKGAQKVWAYLGAHRQRGSDKKEGEGVIEDL